jgi:membrane-associated phospholipid phosphatase
MDAAQKRTYALVALASVLTALFILLALAVSDEGRYNLFVTSFDEGAANIFNVRHAAASIFLFFTYLGSPFVVIAVECALLVFIIIIRRRMLAAFFIGGLIAGESLSVGFKMLLTRARPPDFVYDLPRFGYSFPSGHAVVSTVFYGFAGFCLAHIAKKRRHKMLITIATVLLVFVIGISRILLGYHWASDVIGGWLLGGAVLSLLVSIFAAVHKHTNREKLGHTKGYRREIVIFAIVAACMLALGYYVTHPLKIRSTIEYQLRASRPFINQSNI